MKSQRTHQGSLQAKKGSGKKPAAVAASTVGAAAPAADSAPVNFSTVDRSLDEKLFLVVQRQGESSWFLPQVTLADGETLRTGAERALAAAVDTSATKTYFIGNAPSAVHQRAQEKVRGQNARVCVRREA
jgi:hypothetical protein